MQRIFFFFMGFGLMVIGFTYIITYVNLLSMGYSLIEYFQFIFRRIECLLAPIGFLIISIIIFTKGREGIDLHL